MQPTTLLLSVLGALSLLSACVDDTYGTVDLAASSEPAASFQDDDVTLQLYMTVQSGYFSFKDTTTGAGRGTCSNSCTDHFPRGHRVGVSLFPDPEWVPVR